MKHLAMSAIVALMVAGAPSLALADQDNDNHGDHGDRDSNEHRAPEPVTIIGLALGAVGIGGARWAMRKSKSKP